MKKRKQNVPTAKISQVKLKKNKASITFRYLKELMKLIKILSKKNLK